MKFKVWFLWAVSLFKKKKLY